MDVEIIDPNTYYSLGQGDDQRAVPMLKQVSLGAQYDRTYGQLRTLHESLQNHPQGGPTRAIIESSWLLWCYVSAEITRLNTQLGKIEKKLEEVVAKHES